MLRRFVLALAVAALALPVARAGERQIAFDVRLLTVSDACFAALGQPNAAGGTSLLKCDEVEALLAKAQGDCRTTILTSPKVTALDGQEACVRIEDARCFVTGVERLECNGTPVFVPIQETLTSGVAMTVRGTVLPGGRDIAVKFKADIAHVQDSAPLSPVSTFITPVFEGGAVGKPVPFTQYIQQPTQVNCGVAKMFAVPPGRTAVFCAGRRTREIADEAKVPVLGDLPLLGEFFTVRTSRSEADNLIVLVTPRILECNGGEEAEATPPLARVELDMMTFSVCDCFWANSHGPAARLATDNFVFLGDDGPAFRDALRECGGCTIHAEPRMLTPSSRSATFSMNRLETTFTPTVSADGAFVKIAGTIWGVDAVAGTPVLPTVTMSGGKAAVYKLGRDCATGEMLYAYVTVRTK